MVGFILLNTLPPCQRRYGASLHHGREEDGVINTLFSEDKTCPPLALHGPTAPAATCQSLCTSWTRKVCKATNANKPPPPFSPLSNALRGARGSQIPTRCSEILGRVWARYIDRYSRSIDDSGATEIAPACELQRERCSIHPALPRISDRVSIILTSCPQRFLLTTGRGLRSLKVSREGVTYYNPAEPLSFRRIK